MASARLGFVVAVLLGAAGCDGGVTAPPGGDGGVTGDAAVVVDGGGGGGDGGAGGDGGSGGGDSGPQPDAGAPGTAVVYVGGNTISIFTLDLATGALTSRGTATAASPSFLAVNPARTALYAVEEGSPGRVNAFSITRSGATLGALTSLGGVGSGGNGPAHVSVDRTGKWVLAANYGSGTVAVLPVQSNGGLAAAVDTESPGANAHLITVDPGNQFAFVPCLGVDRVAQFAFNATTGQLTANAVASVATAAGAGPRHLDFRPGGGFAYLINEKNETMTALSYDATQGRLTPVQTLPALPAGAPTAGTSGAEVLVHPSGKFVYGSNRGNNTIVGFALDAGTGMMTLIGHTPTGGNTPRSFAIDPSGNLMLVANQGSGNIHAFRIDQTTGVLTVLMPVTNVTVPAFVGIVMLP